MSYWAADPNELATKKANLRAFMTGAGTLIAPDQLE